MESWEGYGTWSPKNKGMAFGICRKRWWNIDPEIKWIELKTLRTRGWSSELREKEGGTQNVENNANEYGNLSSGLWNMEPQEEGDGTGNLESKGRNLSIPTTRGGIQYSWDMGIELDTLEQREGTWNHKNYGVELEPLRRGWFLESWEQGMESVIIRTRIWFLVTAEQGGGKWNPEIKCLELKHLRTRGWDKGPQEQGDGMLNCNNNGIALKYPRKRVDSESQEKEITQNLEKKGMKLGTMMEGMELEMRMKWRTLANPQQVNGTQKA